MFRRERKIDSEYVIFLCMFIESANSNISEKQNMYTMNGIYVYLLDIPRGSSREKDKEESEEKLNHLQKVLHHQEVDH